ncbi:hypothetical protein IWW57_004408, partial [Coemansia sp. S610]
MVSTARAVSATVSAAGAVWLLYRATNYVSYYLDDKHHRKALCGKGSRWSLSLSSDCFRIGVLWPASLIVAASFTFAALAVYCLLPGGLKSAGFLGVGNQEKPVRHPLGPAIMRDNRACVGRAVVALSVAQAALLVYAWVYQAEAAVFTHTYFALVSHFAVVVAVVNAGFLARYLYSNRLLYAGLFPWPLPVLVLFYLMIGSCEVYYSFFTPATRNVPIFGGNASLYSNALVASTLLSLGLLFTYARAQLRPVFVRPLAAASESGHLEYTPAYDVEANADADDEVTPLARSADQNPVPLVESPEFNVSWYSTLAFSWGNDILRRGSSRTLEATDMYRLDEADLPIPNWRRYLRHRKAGRSLMVTLMMVFAPEFILQAGLALVTSILYFSGPFFLQRILRSIEILGGGKGAGGGVPAEKSIRSAYLDAFGLLFFTLAASVLSNQTMWVGRHIGFRLKGLLVAELSSKTLRRRGKGSWEDAKSDDDDDEEKDDDEDAPTAQAAADGKIMNLLTTDFSRVAEVSAYLDNVYSLPLMLFIGIWYMYMLLGVSALVGLSMSVLYVPLSKMLFKYLTKVEKKLTSLSDERVTVITELLQGIKAVKLFGWESRFLEMVDERRERQLKYMWKLLLAWVRVHVASSLAPMLILVVIFVVYIIGFGNRLTAEIAFTTISVFQLIRIVFEHLPGFLNWVIGGYVALGRIDSYLGQPQVQDLEKRVAYTDSDRDELGFESADLEWESPSSSAKSGNENVVAGKNLAGVNATDATENTPLLADSTAAATPQTQVARSSANESYASLDRDDGDDLVRFALKDIDVRFPHGVLSVVAGPTGSGKS